MSQSEVESTNRNAPQLIAKLSGQIEFSNVKEKGLRVRAATEFVSAFLAERESYYPDEHLRKRKAPNQDCILISQPSNRWHISVADGVGGLPGGEIAAQQTLRYVHRALFSTLDDDRQFQTMEPLDYRERLEFILGQACEHLEKVFANPRKPGATTIVGAFPIGPDRIFIYSVGDSGAALVPRNPLRPVQYSMLHSAYERLIHLGQISRREALLENVSLHNGMTPVHDVLTAAIGGGELSPRDFFCSVMDVKAGDQLFLFSDGLYKTVGRTKRERTDLDDLRQIEYGRFDQLLQFLARPEVHLPILADGKFRSRHEGPEQLIDDLAIARVTMRCEEDDNWQDHASRIVRPRSRTMTPLEEVPTTRLPIEEETFSITANV